MVLKGILDLVAASDNSCKQSKTYKTFSRGDKTLHYSKLKKKTKTFSKTNTFSETCPKTCSKSCFNTYLKTTLRKEAYFNEKDTRITRASEKTQEKSDLEYSNDTIRIKNKDTHAL